MSTASPDRSLPFCTHVKALEVTQRSSCESKVAFKHYLRILLLGARNDQLSTWICGLYARIYIAVACVLHRHSIVCIRKVIPSHISRLKLCSTSWDDNVIILCKFSAPFGFSTCIVVLSNYHCSLIILLQYFTLLRIHHCS